MNVKTISAKVFSHAAPDKAKRAGVFERLPAVAAYVGKKTLVFLFMMFVLSVIVFYVSRLTPGDPLEAFYGGATQSMTVEELDAARARLGLDGPVTRQYLKWAGNVLQGDFGMSLRHKRPVLSVVRPLIGNTLILGGAAYVLVFLLAVILALFCARFEDSLADRLICKIGAAAYYIPAFWLGVVLVLLFSVNLKWLPSSGAYDIGKAKDIANRARHMVLPLVVMVASHLWYYAYMIRNKLLDEVRRDYVLLARSKGLGKTRILLAHCLRNVLPTIVNIMAISIPHVLSGTYIAESVFNYPGIGSLAVSSAKYHDYNLLMLMVLLTGVLVIVSSLLAQAINEAIDPRMKTRMELD
ncbi:MAG: ABC transporter permease [Synergistaceae bacterium]|jgi:peptide/nickel transport system permease protein|nr:ABC transporter permease [Synergistaceae bacterium]